MIEDAHTTLSGLHMLDESSATFANGEYTFRDLRTK